MSQRKVEFSTLFYMCHNRSTYRDYLVCAILASQRCTWMSQRKEASSGAPFLLSRGPSLLSKGLSLLYRGPSRFTRGPLLLSWGEYLDVPEEGGVIRVRGGREGHARRGEREPVHRHLHQID